jgi:hypothetical protein
MIAALASTRLPLAAPPPRSANGQGDQKNIKMPACQFRKRIAAGNGQCREK